MASSLEQLIAMGFPEEMARSCLEAHDGDISRACNVLLGVDETDRGHQQAGREAVQASISQYDVQNGRSACTCICLEASLTVLGNLATGAWQGSPDDVMNIVNVGVAMYEALAGAGALAVEHTAVSEVFAAAARYHDELESATARGCHQGLLGSETSFAGIFEEIKNERRDKSSHVAVAITKPPETVLAFLPPETQGGTSVPGTADPPATGQWLLFDSHPRPQLGLVGASVRSFEGEAALVSALVHIFPAFDLGGADSVMANMYNMVDCTPLALRQAPQSQQGQANPALDGE